MRDKQGVTIKKSASDPITPLMFGIPQLDELLGYHRITKDGDDNNPSSGEQGTQLFDSLRNATSMAIVGEDGTGKSLFALHLASAYAALHYRAVKPPNKEGVGKNRPRIVYASSDYRFEAAETVWKKFYLDHPWHRYIPGIDEEERKFRTSELTLLPTVNQPHLPGNGNKDCGLKVNLNRCALDKVAEHLLNPSFKPAEDSTPGPPWCDYDVNFIDLAKESSGDDWRFITSLVASFPNNPDDPPSLLVVDSVAGFETFIGKTNTFGEESTRRSRVSQLLRAAGASWHVVFIAEEPDQIKHHPEEYVTDTVFHLRRTGIQEKVRRHLEIEKSRARNFAQGEHQFEIRDGNGTSTKSWENPDDLEVSLHPEVLAARKMSLPPRESDKRNKTNAYVQVFPSLHYLSKKFGSRHLLQGPSLQRSYEDPKPFGIKYLDDMLCSERGFDKKKGLRPSTVTALIGEEGTRKIQLAEEFLVAAYDDLPEVVNLFIEMSRDFLAKRVPRTKPNAGTTPEFKLFVTEEIEKRFSAKSRPGAIAPCNEGWKEATIKRLRGRVVDFVASDFDLKQLDEIAYGDYELYDPVDFDRASQRSKRNEGDVNPEHAPLKPRWNLRIHLKSTGKPASKIGRTKTERLWPGSEAGTMALAFSALRLPMGALAPTVFIATHDISSENLASRVIHRHRDVLSGIFMARGIDSGKVDDYLRYLRRVLESWITVRRAELADCTAPQLWYVIECATVQGMTRMGYNASELRIRSVPEALTDQVRVIISDLRLLRDTYPAIVEDSLFLATVVFRLRRFGVTSIIVESDNGRLNQPPSHPMSGALRSLVDHQINTWKVNFFGEERVAITVLPSLGTSTVCLIRELRFGEPAEGEPDQDAEDLRLPLIVDPLFEMFENIEEGSPRAIPLQVQLYGETPAFEQYVKSEKEAFQLTFAPELSLDSPVLRIASTTEYQAYRDYTHLPTGRRLPFSLVMMVDGFWALGRRNTLKNQHEYLFGELPGSHDDRFEDPFRLFSRGPEKAIERDQSQPGNAAPAGAADENSKSEQPKNNRASFFYLGTPENLHAYCHRIDTTFKAIDRVPFMWDFGFLLCNLGQWENAAECELEPTNGEPAQKVRAIFEKMTVHTSRDLLRRCSSKIENREEKAPVQRKGARRLLAKPIEPVTWRDFFEACKLVAATEEKRTGKPCQPFDVAMTTPDLLGCLLFEIWFSEIYKDIVKLRGLHKRIKGKGRLEPIAQEIQTWAEVAESFLMPIMSDKFLYNRQAQSDLNLAVEGWKRDGFDVQATEKDWDFGSAWEKITKPRGGPAEVRFAKKYLSTADRPAFNRFLLLRANSGYSLQLYQSWLLLLEVMDFRAFEACQWSFELACNRNPDPSSPAVRHWYKTACAASKGDLDGASAPCAGKQTRIPVRLPGHFSVRGDWFLAMADGSRSGRLGAQAIDLLSSRRANRSRLQLGLGLPVRDLTAGDEFRRLRTGLTVRTPTGIHRPECDDILRLGGDFLFHVRDEHADWQPRGPGITPPATRDKDKPARMSEAGDRGFFWLFRSGMRDYDRQAVVISRWIQRLFEWTVQVRFEQADNWKGGFEGYDDLERGEISRCKGYASWRRFFGILEILQADLRAATQGADPLPVRPYNSVNANTAFVATVND